MDEGVKNKKQIKRELESLLRPRPNSRLLGMRLGLYYHYKTQKEKPFFLFKWLNKRFGEEPVYFSDADPDHMEDVLFNRLENRGFFYSGVEYEIDSSRHYARVIYTVDIPKPYTLEKFELNRDTSAIYDAIENSLSESEIRLGDRFDL
jgi:hypothetical protein